MSEGEGELMSEGEELRLKPIYRHDGRYGDSARWPVREYEYESGLVGGQQARALLLGYLMTSPDPIDRVRARIYIESFEVTVPAFAVVESPDSPNLYKFDREPTPERRDQIVKRRTVWSAHFDQRDAVAWRDAWQAKFDADLAKHPHWGPGSKRIFVIEYRDDAPVGQLRQPGADPARHIH